MHDGCLTLAAVPEASASGLPATLAEGRVAAAQFLISGCTADEVTLAAGARGFSLKAKQTADGVKVIIYSLTTRTLDGDVLRGLPAGAELRDVRLTNASAERLACRIGAGPVVGIGSTEAAAPVTGSIYDLDGRLVGKGDVRALLKAQPAGVYLINVEGKNVKVKK